MSASVEMKLQAAATEGRTLEVSTLLKNHPDLDVNSATGNDQATALHWASDYGHVEVVKLLLAHPNISVNVKNTFGITPFSYAVTHGHVLVVRELLKDPRVDVKLAEERGCTPLWFAAYYGFLEVVEWLIASGRDLGHLGKRGEWSGNEYTALEIARRRVKTGVALVLERFMTNPAQTRHEVRVKLGVLNALAAEIFALVVFLCDELLQFKPAALAASTTARRRFFTIAKKLPMDLQMILCHRTVGSMKQNISSNNSEAAFKSLARIQTVVTTPPNSTSESNHDVGGKRCIIN